MNKVQATRLLALADFLESNRVKDAQFDMTKWGYKNSECGTAHCVMGWAGVLFKEDLKTHWYSRYNCQIVLSDGKPDEYGDLPNNDAAGQIYFGLTEVEADELFMPKGDNETREEAANKIRATVGKYFKVKTQSSLGAPRADKRGRN